MPVFEQGIKRLNPEDHRNCPALAKGPASTDKPV
jgi:hypothetical protein